MNKSERDIAGLIECRPGISHGVLVDAADMSKHVAEKSIRQLLDDRVIISEKDGKSKRYFMANPDMKDLDRRFSGNMKKIRENLDRFEMVFQKQPYDVRVIMNAVISETLDDIQTKAILERHAEVVRVDGIMADYAARRVEISEMLDVLSDDLKHRLAQHLLSASTDGLLYGVVSEAYLLRMAANALKNGSKRRKLAGRIKELDGMQHGMFSCTEDILGRMRRLRDERKEGDLSYEYDLGGLPPIPNMLRHVEQTRREFYEKMQALKKELEKHAPALNLAVSTSLLESMEGELAEMEDLIDMQYRQTLATRTEEEIHSVLKKAEKHLDEMRRALGSMQNGS